MATFEGDQLLAILSRQSDPVDVRHPKGHVETRYQRATDAIRLITAGGYFGVGNRNRIRYVRPYSVEARIEPWGSDLKRITSTRPPQSPISAAGGKGCVGCRCGDKTLHTRSADLCGSHGDVVRRI